MLLPAQLLEVALLKRKTQDVTFSWYYALIVLFFYTFTTYLQIVQIDFTKQPLLFCTVQTLIQVSTYYLLLSLYRKTPRFVQTITSIFGVQALLQTIALVVIHIPILSLLLPLTSIWSISISVIILMQALDISVLRAIFLTLVLFIVSGICLAVIFPEPYQTLVELLLNNSQVK